MICKEFRGWCAHKNLSELAGQRLRAHPFFALKLPIGLAFRYAPFPGDSLERIHLVQTFALSQLFNSFANAQIICNALSDLWSCLDQQNYLSSDAITPGQDVADFRDGAAQEFLMHLCQFAGDDYLAIRGPDALNIGKSLQNTVRRFVEDQRGELIDAGLQLFEITSAGCGLWRQKSQEEKTLCFQAGRDQPGKGGIGPRHSEDGNTGPDGCPGQKHTGIGNPRYTCVGYHGDALSAKQVRDKLGGAPGLIVFVQAGGRRFDAVVIQELLSLPRVLASYAVYRLQHAQSTERDVLKVTDRGSNQIQARSQNLFPGRWPFIVRHLCLAFALEAAVFGKQTHAVAEILPGYYSDYAAVNGHGHEGHAATRDSPNHKSQ
jgi:hypothetical protein